MPQEALGFNCRDLDQDKSIVKILGIVYDANRDAFLLNGRDIAPTKAPTKRCVLSSISRLFDPMGFAGPVTMKAKLFMQELWQHNLEWDAPLSTELETFWNCIRIRIGYGCCIYIKVKNGDKCSTHLLCSKSRLNGVNSKLTIPKFKLNGALLLSKLILCVCNIVT